MNYTQRRKRYNNKKTRKHRGGINWKFWEKTPASAPAVVPAAAPENKCPPCPVCAQKEQAEAQQAQAQQAQVVPEQMQPQQVQAEQPSLMSGGKKRTSIKSRGKKSIKSRGKKSKKWFQMGCKKN